jgi:hypothetical protein
MKNLSCWVFAASIICLPTIGIASTLSDCNAVASKLNEQTPMRVDKLTTWKTTICISAPTGVRLLYVYFIDVASGQVTQANLNTLRAGQLKSWCSNPDQRKLIDLVDIEYQYLDNDSGYIGVLDYQHSMCSL